ncbi:hypothetical protein F383_33257 [Gossypium arboreum]|uniref:Uncharacterized protein n=1 Tax=Gossypium arboreum TaxID=29729 RepID=A0A0B0N1L9_GOSAR|nr:hypothetical protein F383_33257 [Gossypium arboreum]
MIPKTVDSVISSFDDSRARNMNP